MKKSKPNYQNNKIVDMGNLTYKKIFLPLAASWLGYAVYKVIIIFFGIDLIWQETEAVTIGEWIHSVISLVFYVVSWLSLFWVPVGLIMKFINEKKS